MTLSAQSFGRRIGTVRAVVWTCIALAAGTLFVFPPEHSHLYPQCLVHQWFGLLCPGCGGTRAAAALLHGHIREALRHNALVTLLLPVAAASIPVDLLACVTHRADTGVSTLDLPSLVARVPDRMWAWSLAALVAFGVLRNLA